LLLRSSLGSFPANTTAVNTVLKLYQCCQQSQEQSRANCRAKSRGKKYPKPKGSFSFPLTVLSLLGDFVESLQQVVNDV